MKERGCPFPISCQEHSSINCKWRWLFSTDLRIGQRADFLYILYKNFTKQRNEYSWNSGDTICIKLQAVISDATSI